MNENEAINYEVLVCCEDEDHISSIFIFIFRFLNLFDWDDMQVFRRWIVSRLLTCSFGTKLRFFAGSIF